MATTAIPSAQAPPRTEEREAKARAWPRISLVTPVRNAAKYLEQTIRSVLVQDYPNLDYFIVDGGSTDGTVEIIRKYEEQISGWVSEPDGGMYEAINKGFALTTGEIMGWISATDMPHIGGLRVVGSVFREFAEVEWITGRPTKFSAEGATIEVMELPHWARMRFLAGANKYIQQESTFWRRSLWEQAGGRVDESLRAEGDFELWVRFFRHAKLYPVDALIGGYRLHEGAQGSSDLRRYDGTCERILTREIESLPRGGGMPKVFRWISQAVQPIPKVRGLWHRVAIRGLYRVSGPDLAPVIRYDTRSGWRMGR